MSDPQDTSSPQVNLIHEWAQGFRARDLSLMAKVLHKDYRNVTYPRSLGTQEETREEWLEKMAGVVTIWTSVEVRSVTIPPCRG